MGDAIQVLKEFGPWSAVLGFIIYFLLNSTIII
jgi:hypothetical protein